MESRAKVGSDHQELGSGYDCIRHATPRLLSGKYHHADPGLVTENKLEMKIYIYLYF